VAAAPAPDRFDPGDDERLPRVRHDLRPNRGRAGRRHQCDRRAERPHGADLHRLRPGQRVLLGDHDRHAGDLDRPSRSGSRCTSWCRSTGSST
jgi:hypothetical protein